jgi:hypothetical protein
MAAQLAGEITSLLGRPLRGGVRGDAGDVELAGAMFEECQCVQAPASDRVHMEEVRGDDPVPLPTRSSRPHSIPTKTSDEVEQKVLTARAEHRDGPDVLGPKFGVPPRTVSRILRRHDVPYLRECASMTGEVIRSSKNRPPCVTNATGPTSWSRWTSRRSAASPTAAVGVL